MSSDKTKVFDLTTSSGMDTALIYLNQFGSNWLRSRPEYWIYVASKKALESIRETLPTPKIQEESAIDILKSGRDIGLSEVEIIIDQKIGVDFGAKLPTELNIDIKVKASKNNTTTIRAKYRDV